MTRAPERISTETALRLLADEERRLLIRRVAADPDGTTVDRLAAHLRRRDSDRAADGGGTADAFPPAGDGGVDDRAIQLRHVHLPKLAAAAVFEYDPERGTVAAGPEFQTVHSLLEVIASHRPGPPPDLS